MCIARYRSEEETHTAPRLGQEWGQGFPTASGSTDHLEAGRCFPGNKQTGPREHQIGPLLSVDVTLGSAAA
jgi:hypothetical protein